MCVIHFSIYIMHIVVIQSETTLYTYIVMLFTVGAAML